MDWSLGGNDLLLSIDDVLDGKAEYIPSYSQAKSILAKSDADPENPNNIISFYSGKSVSGWNREHVWPASRLVSEKSNEGADPHMLRACDTKINSSRGNYYYGESGQWTYDPAKEGVPAYRGNAARIIFYEACRWQEKGLEIDDTPRAQSDHPATMGKISDLMKWNIVYDVMEEEDRRNEVIDEEIGIRNPFIDAPEIACRIYKDWIPDNIAELI